jgi:hypothetical protein
VTPSMQRVLAVSGASICADAGESIRTTFEVADNSGGEVGPWGARDSCFVFAAREPFRVVDRWSALISIQLKGIACGIYIKLHGSGRTHIHNNGSPYLSCLQTRAISTQVQG